MFADISFKLPLLFMHTFIVYYLYTDEIPFVNIPKGIKSGVFLKMFRPLPSNHKRRPALNKNAEQPEPPARKRAAAAAAADLSKDDSSEDIGERRGRKSAAIVSEDDEDMDDEQNEDEKEFTVFDD